MSDTLHSNDLNNKGTTTLLGREMIIRHRGECHGDQVKGHHDWNTLKCITACNFNNTVQYYFTEYIVDLKMMQQFLILEITNSELLIGTMVGSWTVKMPISFMCPGIKFVIHWSSQFYNTQRTWQLSWWGRLMFYHCRSHPSCKSKAPYHTLLARNLNHV